MNWTEIILWAALAALFVTLIVISSPIRFGMTADYKKAQGMRRTIGGTLWLSYIHPALFIYKYSSRGRHHEELRFFGFDVRKWRRKHKHHDDGADASDAAGADDHVTPDADIYAGAYDYDADTDTSPHIDTDDQSGAKKYADADADDNYDDDDDDPLWARAAEKIRHVADEEHIAQAIEDIRNLGTSGTVRFLRDKPLRNKVFRWALRSSGCALRMVRLDKFKIWTRVGFIDPVRAGKAYGYFIAAKNALELQSKTVDLNMEPVFMEKRLEADAEFAGRTSIAMTLSGFLAIALTFPYLRVHRFRKKIGEEDSLREKN